MSKIKHLLLILLLPAIALGQEKTFIIKGTIQNSFPGQKVYLMYFRQTRIIDSAVVQLGTFTFKGPADISNEPEENYQQAAGRLFVMHKPEGFNFNTMRIVLDGPSTLLPEMRIVYIESGLTEINMVDSARTAKIKGPPSASAHYTLDSIYTAFFKKMNKATLEGMKILKDRPAAERMNYITRQSGIFKEEQKRDQWLFVRNHPSSPVSLYVLKHMDNEFYPDYDRIAPYYDALAPELKETKFGREYGLMLAGLKSTRIGAAAPDFILNDTVGKPISLSSLKGKYVLLDFWASWCGPCRAENPDLVQVHNKFKDQNFVILGVSLDKDRAPWLKAIADDHLEWKHVSDLKYWDSDVAHLYSVTAIPQNFLVDPGGKIIAKNLTGEVLINKLKQVLRK